MCLGPTHEEVITEVAKNYVQSYRQLPFVLYQIQTKFRDEVRPRFGVVRACEFIMKDAYSFDRDKKGLDRNYQLMYEAYKKIFNRCQLKTIIIEADSGAMGGDVSHEYMVKTPIGEDAILVCGACGYAGGFTQSQYEQSLCPKCKKDKLEKKITMEIGHIFQLGTKYTQVQEAFFLDEHGKEQPMMMGCYGIGVSRLMAAIIEVHNDASGIIWPAEVSPFDVEILPLQVKDSEIAATAKKFYDDFQSLGLEVLWDDRDESAGIKFNDADLIGIPYRVILGKRMLLENKVEIKNRRTGEMLSVSKNDVKEKLAAILKENHNKAYAGISD